LLINEINKEAWEKGERTKLKLKKNTRTNSQFNIFAHAIYMKLSKMHIVARKTLERKKNVKQPNAGALKNRIWSRNT